MYAECGPVVMGGLTNKARHLSLDLEAVGRDMWTSERVFWK